MDIVRVYIAPQLAVLILRERFSHLVYHFTFHIAINVIIGYLMLINHVPTVAIQGLQHQFIFFLFRQKMLKKLDVTDFTNFRE